MNRKKESASEQGHSPAELGPTRNNNDKCFFDLIRWNEEMCFQTNE